MSLIRNHTGFHYYPLSTGSGDTATFAHNDVMTFNLKNVPIVVGNLAYYTYGIAVTFVGALNQPASGAAAINRDELIRCLIDSIELRNAWHGTPLSSRQIKGSMLPIIEFVGCGYQDGQRGQGQIPTTDASHNFRLTVFIPLVVGLGDKPHHTAQLTLFYKQAQLDINTAPSTVLDGLDLGAAFTATSVRASMCMLPEPEVRLGPGVEWVDYQSAATSGQSQIELDSFGNKTGLSGTIPNAGVVWMGALTTSVGGGLGSFAASSVTRYSFPWRGQVDIRHIDPFVTMQLMAMGASRPDSIIVGTASTPEGYVNGFPYLRRSQIDMVSTATAPGLTGLMFWPMVTPAEDLELTKVQLAKGTQAYFLDATFSGNTNHTLVQHVRSFDDDKRADAVKQIVDSGLAKAVIGQETDLGWLPKLLKKQDEIDPNKLRFLPFRLVPREPKKVFSPQAMIARGRGR